MKLKNNTFIEIIKFVLFSISAGAIQFISFAVCDTLLKFGWQTSYLIALILSIVWNFTFNRRFTFKSQCKISLAMIKIIIFYIIFIPSSTLFGNWLIQVGWHDYLITFINMILNMTLEYFYDKFIVFQKK